MIMVTSSHSQIMSSKNVDDGTIAAAVVRPSVQGGNDMVESHSNDVDDVTRTVI